MFPLSPREEQLMRLLCSGEATNAREQAIAMGITIDTVKMHHVRIHNKTGMRSTVLLVIWGIKNGYGV